MLVVKTTKLTILVLNSTNLKLVSLTPTTIEQQSCSNIVVVGGGVDQQATRVGP